MNEDLIQSMLHGLTSGEGRTSSMSEMLAQLGESDPRMGLLAKYFAQREAMAAEQEPEVLAPEEPVRSGGQRRAAVEKLHRLVEKMYAELEVLRERNDSLAAALGACHLCWGEEPVCPACAGDGAPGASAADDVLFRHYVGPVIRQMSPRPARPAVPRPPAMENAHFTESQNNHKHHERNLP